MKSNKSFSLQNVNKPSNKKLKLIADYLLYVFLPAINTFFIAVQPINEKFSLWGIAISNLLITLFKGLTKLTINKDYGKEDNI